MKQPLKQQLNQHLKQIELKQHQLSELEDLMDEEGMVSKVKPRFRVRTLAAFGALLLTVAALLSISPLQQNFSKDMPELIAVEVVKNHLKLKPMEIKTSAINDIRGYFSKLEFMPVDSRMTATEGLKLLGGRYCSIQGVTAAQLRMKQGVNLQTLYQTQYIEDVFGPIPKIDKGEEPLVVFANGIKVKIWVEKGLLMALTDAPPVN